MNEPRTLEQRLLTRRLIDGLESVAGPSCLRWHSVNRTIGAGYRLARCYRCNWFRWEPTSW